MTSSSNNVVLVSEEEVAAAQEACPPHLYLSCGMVAMKDMRLVLTDVVEAAPSFTLLSPRVRLDFFAVLDGRGLDAAATGSESKRLLALLRDALAGQVYSDLCSDESRDDVVEWWATTLREAYQAFHEEVAAYSQGEHGMDTPTAAATVGLVLEKYVVIGICGASKAVLSWDGEPFELISSEHMANRGDGSGLVDVVAVERDACEDFLILGTAALWDKVTPAAACAHVRREAREDLAGHHAVGVWETRIADAACEELAKKAVDAGNRDNVSVGLVVFRDFCAAGHAQAGNIVSAGDNVQPDNRRELRSGRAGRED